MCLLFSCSGTEEKKNKLGTGSESKEKKNEFVNAELRWVEYKKVPPNNIHDTVPYPNTFFIIKNNLFFYYRDNKLYSQDSIFLNKEYDYPAYKFKKNSYDMLYFEGKDDEYGILKRDAFEGEYEYFRKEKI